MMDLYFLWWSVSAKNHTHVKKVGHISEFPFGIYWWTLKNPKNQNFEKMKKKLLKISSFYICEPKTTIMRYSSWYTKWEFFFFVILGHFLPFTPSPYNNPENQNFEKMEASGDVITLNLCYKKHNHMMYAYSDMECDRHNFLTF